MSTYRVDPVLSQTFCYIQELIMCAVKCLFKKLTTFTRFRVQMVFGTFLVASLLGDLKQLFVMIQILRGVEILPVVYYKAMGIYYFKFISSF